MRSLVHKIGFFAALIIPALVVAGFYLGGSWNYLALCFSFFLIPLLDELLGVDTRNVPATHITVVGEAFYYRFVTYVWVYVQLAFVGWAAYASTTGNLTTLWDWVGFVLGCGLVTGGIGITVAHELGHKKPALERFYAKVLLTTVCYGHFYIEHNRGHHVTVATPVDPATARKGEPFYAFWVRSVFGGYRHAWHLEKERLHRSQRPVWSLHNEMIRFAVLPLLLCTALTAVLSAVNQTFAWQVPAFFFAQSLVAFTLLELVNYIEHYGIMRKEIAPGRYERVNPTHSWNASQLVSNFFLFQLQRHSDHHAFAHKRYQVLNHYDESPQLPYGYSAMVVVALCPPVWFWMMDRRLEAWQRSHMAPA